MRSLQIRLPVLAIAIVALSLGVAAVAVFETLLLTGNDRLDETLEREMLTVREYLALNAPGALAGPGCVTGPAPAELVGVIERHLEQRGRGESHMTVAHIGGRVLSTPDAPTILELLRDRSELPAPSADQLGGEPAVVASSEGEVRMLATGLCVADGSGASVAVLGSRGEIRTRALIALVRMSAAAAVGLLLAGICLAFAIRRMLRPLNELARAARDAELEDLGGRVELRARSDEIGELTREFNRMLDRIESSVDAQRRFMASISHELRTPITIARGHLDLLVGSPGARSEAQVAETANLVREELLRMQRLVADLITLGKAGDADFVVAGPVRLRELFDDLQLRVVGLGSRNVRFEAVPDDVVHVDQDRLAQAVLNLVANADVHASGRSQTTVSAHVVDGWLRITVADDGAGIEPAISEKVFEPFVHTGNSRQSTGLGLSVVQAIATAHGGRVGLDSDQTGTSVSLTVPAGS